jgi:hypothetical protein
MVTMCRASLGRKIYSADPELKRLALDYLENFAPLILAAMRTGAVRKNFLMAIRTFRKLRGPQGIMGAAC